MRCNYDIAWTGRCSNEAAPGKEYCSRHLINTCGVCGEQATHDCDYAGQFVCGFPLCNHCEGWHTGEQSTWGFIGHKHRRKAGQMTEKDWKTVFDAVNSYFPVTSRAPDKLLGKLRVLKARAREDD